MAQALQKISGEDLRNLIVSLSRHYALKQQISAQESDALTRFVKKSITANQTTTDEERAAAAQHLKGLKLFLGQNKALSRHMPARKFLELDKRFQAKLRIPQPQKTATVTPITAAKKAKPSAPKQAGIFHTLSKVAAAAAIVVATTITTTLPFLNADDAHADTPPTAGGIENTFLQAVNAEAAANDNLTLAELSVEPPNSKQSEPTHIVETPEEPSGYAEQLIAKLEANKDGELKEAITAVDEYIAKHNITNEKFLALYEKAKDGNAQAIKDLASTINSGGDVLCIDVPKDSIVAHEVYEAAIAQSDNTHAKYAALLDYGYQQFDGNKVIADNKAQAVSIMAYLKDNAKGAVQKVADCFHEQWTEGYTGEDCQADPVCTKTAIAAVVPLAQKEAKTPPPAEKPQAPADRPTVRTTYDGPEILRTVVKTRCDTNVNYNVRGDEMLSVKASCSIPTAESTPGWEGYIKSTATCHAEFNGQSIEDTTQCTARTVERNGKDILQQLEEKGISLKASGKKVADCTIKEGFVRESDRYYNKHFTFPQGFDKEFKMPVCDVHDNTARHGDSVTTTVKLSGGRTRTFETVVNATLNNAPIDTQNWLSHKMAEIINMVRKTDPKAPDIMEKRWESVALPPKATL